MKVFNDKKTARKFVELYETLNEDGQKVMGQKVRDLAECKMEGDGDEFYVTAKDLTRIYESISIIHLRRILDSK